MELPEVLNVERVQELENWLQKTKTTLVQVNGQRKYGGPPLGWDGPAPGAYCEVFINHIPRDTYEDLLIPLFSSVGTLWEFRLMMNFSGQNRGFAYAKYTSAVEAARAVDQLHGYMLQPGSRITVCHSTEKKYLCIGGLPANTPQDFLLQVLREMAEGVEKVTLNTRPGVEEVSAIVGFSSHHTASLAKKILVETFMKKFSLHISINWQVKSGWERSHQTPRNFQASPAKQPGPAQIPPQPAVVPIHRPQPFHRPQQTRRPPVPPRHQQPSDSHPRRPHLPSISSSPPSSTNSFSCSSSSSSTPSSPQGCLRATSPTLMLPPEAGEVTGFGRVPPQPPFSFFN